jgi:hypothetical protein
LKLKKQPQKAGAEVVTFSKNKLNKWAPLGGKAHCQSHVSTTFLNSNRSHLY